MAGYARIEDWSQLSKQLDHAHTLYEQYIPFLTDTSKSHIFADAEPYEVLFPVALYVTVLGRAGVFQKPFDVFHELPTDGPYAASPVIHGALLDALARRRYTVPREEINDEFRAAIAREAKYVWRRIARSMERQPGFVLDERIIDSLLKTLALAGNSDGLAFEVIRDHFGLLRPEDPLPKKKSREKTEGPEKSTSSDQSSSTSTRKPKKHRVQLSPLSLLSVLKFTNSAHKPEYCVHYAQQVMHGSRHWQSLFGYAHAEETLHAHNALALSGDTTQATQAADMLSWIFQRGGKDEISPRGTEFKCHSIAWRISATCGDWNAAKRIFYISTGETADSGPRSKQKSPKAKGRDLLSIDQWIHMVKSATSSGSPTNIAQCMDMFDCFAQSLVVKWIAVGKSRGYALEQIREEFREPLSEHQRLAAAIVNANWSHAREEVHSAVRTAAKEFLSKVGGHQALARRGLKTARYDTNSVDVEDTEAERKDVVEREIKGRRAKFEGRLLALS